MAATPTAWWLGTPPVRAGLLLAVTCLLLDGFPYGFWNACFFRPPGDIGRLPQFAGAALQMAMVPILVATRRTQFDPQPISPRAWAIGLAAAWLAFGALLFILIRWLQHGLAWSE